MATARPRLLIIDDEPMMANIVAAAARDHGYDPLVTHDHQQFRALVADTPPDAISLDLGMPEADGVELLRYLGERQFSGPVMVISGFDRRVIETASRLGQALGLDMHGPLEKPARLDALGRILDGMIGPAR